MRVSSELHPWSPQSSRLLVVDSVSVCVCALQTEMEWKCLKKYGEDACHTFFLSFGLHLTHCAFFVQFLCVATFYLTLCCYSSWKFYFAGFFFFLCRFCSNNYIPCPVCGELFLSSFLCCSLVSLCDLLSLSLSPLKARETRKRRGGLSLSSCKYLEHVQTLTAKVEEEVCVGVKPC